MRHTIPSLNRKVYRSPRERMRLLWGGSVPRMTGRTSMYRDYYAPKSTDTMRKIRIILALIAGALVIQSIFQLPLFRIRTVDVQGLQYLTLAEVQPFIQEELDRRRWVIFKNSNYFLFSRKKFSKRLADHFYLEVVRLDTSFPRSVSVAVRERVTAFVLQTPDGYFSLGSDGIIVSDSKTLKPTHIIIADERSARAQSVPLSYLEQATTIIEQWQQAIPGVAVDRFHITDDDDRIILSTKPGFQIFFDPEQDIPQQLARLAVFLQDRDIARPDEYIDLRFGKRLYLK